MKDLKILVIDPDFDYLQLLSQFLGADGFHVVTATDGEEGLRKAMIESPDLILIEPMLSKLHGFTLCNIVSKEFKKRIPVIILTNHYQEARFKREALNVYGAAAYLKRPVMKKELRSTIFDVLGKKSGDGREEEPTSQAIAEETHPAPVTEAAAPEIVTENPTEGEREKSEEVVTEETQEILTEGAKEIISEEPEDTIPKESEEIVSAESNEAVTEESKEIVSAAAAVKETVVEENAELTAEAAEKPAQSSGNNGNGSNGKSIVDKMLNDIESEFGLLRSKKLPNRNQDLQI